MKIARDAPKVNVHLASRSTCLKVATCLKAKYKQRTLVTCINTSDRSRQCNLLESEVIAIRDVRRDVQPPKPGVHHCALHLVISNANPAARLTPRYYADCRG